MNININKFLQSKVFLAILLAIVCFLVLTFAFKMGEIVGAKKADFSCHWSDNYHRNFGGPKQGFFQGLGDKDFIEANGVVGKVIKIASSSLAIQGRGDIEKIVSLTNQTVIKKFQETIAISDLKTGDLVVVIGEPNTQGQIEAKLIRVMPQAPLGMQMENSPRPSRFMRP